MQLINQSVGSYTYRCDNCGAEVSTPTPTTFELHRCTVIPVAPPPPVPEPRKRGRPRKDSAV